MAELYVNETGTRGAPSIVFLHGVGASGWMWEPQTTALSDFHCLNVDLPNHGKSHEITWVSLADTADKVSAVIRSHANNGRAHIVGLSLGGFVALFLLERHADIVDHTIISGVTVEPLPNLWLLGPQLALFSMTMKRRGFASRQAKALNLSPEMQTAFVENLMLMPMSAYRAIADEAFRYQLAPSLAQVQNPTLITAGSRESKNILQAVKSVPKLMPNAQGRIASGVRHGWNVEAPQLFSAMVRAWLTDTPLPAGLQALEHLQTDV